MMYVGSCVTKAWLLNIEGLTLAWQVFGREYKGDTSTTVMVGDVSHSKLNLIVELETLRS